MVPNFVASIYGMNFAHLIPPSEWEYGFVGVVAFLVVMVACGASSTPVCSAGFEGAYRNVPGLT